MVLLPVLAGRLTGFVREVRDPETKPIGGNGGQRVSVPVGRDEGGSEPKNFQGRLSASSRAMTRCQLAQRVLRVRVPQDHGEYIHEVPGSQDLWLLRRQCYFP